MSGWFHFLRINPPGAEQTLNFDDYVTTFAERWKFNILSGLSFEKRNPDRSITVRYEDLSLNCNFYLEKILRFLEIESSPDIVQQCMHAGSFQVLSGGRARGEEDQNSLFRKGVVGDWKNHFTHKHILDFEKIAGDLLEQLGYETVKSKKKS